MEIITQSSSQFQDVSELDAALAATLLRWGLSFADTKQKIGLRISEWVNGTPALEAAVGASAITQDELGHARSLYPVWRKLPNAPAALGAENRFDARETYFNPRVLDTPWDSWLDVIAVNVLLDRALHSVISAMCESSLAPLRHRARKMAQEEQYHRIFGDSWLTRLAQHDKIRPRLQASLDRIWPITFAWLGPAGDADMSVLYEAHILTAHPDTLRQRCLDQVTSLLQKNQLTTPLMQLDWSKWNAQHRDIESVISNQ